MDAKVSAKGIGLVFWQTAKTPDGVQELDHTWTRTYRRKDVLRRLGIGTEDARYITTMFVIMGEVQIRFRKKER